MIQTAFLGDVILAVPLLSLLRRQSTVRWVGVLAAPAGAEFLRHQGLADAVVEYDKRDAARGWAGFAAVVRRVRGLGADAAVVPHRSFRSALVAFLAGVPRRVGFTESGGRLLLTDRVPYRRSLHEAEREAGLLEPLGVSLPPGRLPFRISVRPEDASRLDAVLTREGVGADSLVVVVAPGSRWATKRWLPARFAEVADSLSRKHRAVIVIAGDAGDRSAGEAVAREMGAVAVDLTGRLDVGTWLALVNRAGLLVSNDSAAAHAAAGLGTPVVAVFGPTVPDQGFAPYTDDARVVGCDLECRPCGKHGHDRCPRGTMDCMAQVRAPMVLRAASELLGTR